ncbi:hypothetical protein F3C99_12645 [Vitellibacter sp. q18]|nr:hypothetical protein [Aequorivita lutea]
MNIKILDRIISWIALTLIIFYYAYFLLGNVTEDGSDRTDRIFLILLILIFAFYAIKTISFLKDFKALFVFIILYLFSSLFTAKIENLLSVLPTILFVLTSFYLFFYMSYNEKISRKQLLVFCYLLLIVFLIKFFEVYFFKSEVLQGNVYKMSNNYGYYFIMLMPIIFLVTTNKIKQFLFATFFLLLVLFSFKRGAIVSMVICYLYILLTLFKSFKSKKNRYLIFLIVSIIFSGVTIYIFRNLEIFTYRFQLEGGSGRDIILSSIWSDYINRDFIELIIGKGFFSTLDITKSNLNGVSQMAHNDFLEVLSDIGLIGLIIYCSVLVSFINYRNVVKEYCFQHYHAYILVLLIWFVKALVSGVFMDKSCMLLFLALGMIIGETQKNKKISFYQF